MRIRSAPIEGTEEFLDPHRIDHRTYSRRPQVNMPVVGRSITRFAKVVDPLGAHSDQSNPACEGPGSRTVGLGELQVLTHRHSGSAHASLWLDGDEPPSLVEVPERDPGPVDPHVQVDADLNPVPRWVSDFWPECEGINADLRPRHSTTRARGRTIRKLK